MGKGIVGGGGQSEETQVTVRLGGIYAVVEVYICAYMRLLCIKDSFCRL